MSASSAVHRVFGNKDLTCYVLSFLQFRPALDNGNQEWEFAFLDPDFPPVCSGGMMLLLTCKRLYAYWWTAIERIPRSLIREPHGLFITRGIEFLGDGARLHVTKWSNGIRNFICGMHRLDFPGCVPLGPVRDVVDLMHLGWIISYTSGDIIWPEYHGQLLEALSFSSNISAWLPTNWQLHLEQFDVQLTPMDTDMEEFLKMRVAHIHEIAMRAKYY